MVVRTKKKSRKYRGFNRGRGNGKRARGAGNRGGRGRAGLGKRAGHNKLKYLRYPELGRIGAHGFKSAKQAKNFHPKAINVQQIDSMISTLIRKNLAVKKAEGIEINLSKIGYGKLLGTGKVKNKLIVTVSKFTKSAKQKIESAGGKITS